MDVDRANTITVVIVDPVLQWSHVLMDVDRQWTSNQ